jgi:hypothetical protein
MSADIDIVTMPKSALDAMLEDAAERGARKALASVGLHDEHAPSDIRGLRDLLASYRTVKKGALEQIGKGLALAILGALVFWASSKYR